MNKKWRFYFLWWVNLNLYKLCITYRIYALNWIAFEWCQAYTRKSQWIIHINKSAIYIHAHKEDEEIFFRFNMRLTKKCVAFSLSHSLHWWAMQFIYCNIHLYVHRTMKMPYKISVHIYLICVFLLAVWTTVSSPSSYFFHF